VRIVIADDSALIREGVARVLVDAGHEVVARAGDASELTRAVSLESPDLVVVDVRMPPTFTDEGTRAALELRADQPELRVLVLSQVVETHHALQLLRDHAKGLGYLLKDRVVDVDEFVEAVRRIGAGGTVVDPEVVSQLLGSASRDELAELTTREREVLGLVAEGRSNRAICERLFISPKTLESHITSIFLKLGLLPSDDDHRRVLAVLSYLRGSSG
jgi:DNA-binding NarL/FixJ family response regulator